MDTSIFILAWRGFAVSKRHAWLADSFGFDGWVENKMKKLPKKRGPRQGYDFKEKEKYRNLVYSHAVASFDPYVEKKRIMILPSLEGREIQIALGSGFKEENIIIVDDRPAIVATLKRKYPKVKAYGVDLAIACEREAATGSKIDMLNADLCGNIGPSIYNKLRRITKSGVLNDGALFFITMLAGRERFNIANANSSSQGLVGWMDMFCSSRDGEKRKSLKDIQLIFTENDLYRMSKVATVLCYHIGDGDGCFAGYENHSDSSGLDFGFSINEYNDRPSFLGTHNAIKAFGKYRSVCGQSMVWACFLMEYYSDLKFLESFVRHIDSINAYYKKHGR